MTRGQITMRFDPSVSAPINIEWKRGVRLGDPAPGGAHEAAVRLFRRFIRDTPEDGFSEDEDPTYDNWLRYYGTMDEFDAAVGGLRRLGYGVRVAEDPRRHGTEAEVMAAVGKLGRGEALSSAEEWMLAATAAASFGRVIGK